MYLERGKHGLEGGLRKPTVETQQGGVSLPYPMTAAFGSREEMEKAIEMLEEVKESIINAYEIKTNLSRARISHLMDSETWMNARRAIELGFADAMMTEEKITAEMPAFEFSDRAVEMALVNKITAKARQEKPVKHGRSVDELMERLSLLTY